jgi:serine/threonine protein kinase
MASAAHPDLPGYEYVRVLGSGGYAHVYLYWNVKLRRHVAIKVLRDGTSDREAQAMAAVSAHPHIVEIYDTGVAPDGRPFLVMQYYRGPTFAERIRLEERLSVGEVLRVGVQLAGAVQSAHLAGILHLDIKPANILSDEDRPGLTDFGIASVASASTDAKVVSLPWGPTEVLRERGTDARSDVFALAATLHTMLVGHAPYVVPGGDNSDRALLERSLSAPIPRITRPEVPPDLVAVLRAAIDRDPGCRPASSDELGHALQAVESHLGYRQTHLDIRRTDDHRHEPLPDPTPTGLPVPKADLALALSPVTPPPAGDTGDRPTSAIGDAGARSEGVPAAEVHEVHEGEVHAPSGTGDDPVHRAPLAVIGAGLLAVLITVAAGAAIMTRDRSPGGQPQPTRPIPALPSVVAPVDEPVQVAVVADGVSVSWHHPDPDRHWIQWRTRGSGEAWRTGTATGVVLPPLAPGSCVEVRVQRLDDSHTSKTREGCLP